MTGINILARVEQAMATDTEQQDKQSDLIIEAYTEATGDQQALVDRIFIALCGWSLKTILAGQDQTEDNE